MIPQFRPSPPARLRPGETDGPGLVVTSKGARSMDEMGVELQQMLLVLDPRRMWSAGAGRP